MRASVLAVLATASCLLAQAPRPTPAKAEGLVKAAIAFAKANGADKLIHETNAANGRFHVGSGGELYIFIYGTDGVCKAIGFETEKIVGQNRMALKDPDGKLYVREFITKAKTEGKGWVEYKRMNPLDKKIENKVSYVELHEGLVIGAGIYKD